MLMPNEVRTEIVSLEDIPAIDGRPLFGATCKACLRSNGDVLITYGVRANEKRRALLRRAIPTIAMYGHRMTWHSERSLTVTIVAHTYADVQGDPKGIDIAGPVQTYTKGLVADVRSRLSARTPHQATQATTRTRVSHRDQSPKPHRRQPAFVAR